METVNNYILSPEAMVMVSGSSIGTQEKYYDKGYWYKKDLTGYEGKADRHFNNIGLIANAKENIYLPSPVFDNGNSLLSNMNLFPMDVVIEENAKSVIGQPFCANPERQAYELGIELKLDYTGLKEDLSKEPDSRAVETLYFQLDKYETLLKSTDIA